jgi:YesN/AraC family two-component response regulator
LQHVSTLFKKEVGVTFQEYVQSVRIKESCRLLINTDQKVADIATKVGYSNIKFFNEVFKRHMEMTPRDFRKKFTKG